MPGENARRDQALEGIARYLGKIESHLSTIAKNTKPVEHNMKAPDPFGPTGPPEPVKPEGLFPEPTHPYLKRSEHAPEPRSSD